MPRWDLVYKWADPETRSLVDAVTSALENCDHKLTEAAATERRLTVERMAKDVEARIRSGAYLTYHAGPSNLVRDSADSILDDLATPPPAASVPAPEQDEAIRARHSYADGRVRPWDTCPDENHARDLHAALATPPPVPAAPHRPVKRIQARQAEERCLVDGEFWPCTTVQAIPAAPGLDEGLLAAVMLERGLSMQHVHGVIDTYRARLSPDQKEDT